MPLRERQAPPSPVAPNEEPLHSADTVAHSRHTPAVRRRVSRETRRLLIAASVAVTILWGLARIRFPDRPAAPQLVPPALTSPPPASGFAELAAQLTDLQQRIQPLLVLPTSGTMSLALRVAPDRAVAWLAPDIDPSSFSKQDLVAFDGASRIAVVRAVADDQAPTPRVWSRRRPEGPWYIFAAAPTTDGVSVTPLLVTAVNETVDPALPGPLWSIRTDGQLVPGTYVFTAEAELVGLVTALADDVAVVPAAVLLSEASALAEQPRSWGGQLDIDVSPLTPALARAVGVTPNAGVMVSWVSPRSGAAGRLTIGDIIQSVDGQPLEHPRQWAVRVARLAAGDRIRVQLRRGTSAEEIELVASASIVAENSPVLGLAVSAGDGGSRVERVDEGSAGAKAGLRAGDVITHLDGIVNPSPRQIRLRLGQMEPGDTVLAAIRRESAHSVVALQR